MSHSAYPDNVNVLTVSSGFGLAGGPSSSWCKCRLFETTFQTQSQGLGRKAFLKKVERVGWADEEWKGFGNRYPSAFETAGLASEQPAFSSPIVNFPQMSEQESACLIPTEKKTHAAASSRCGRRSPTLRWDGGHKANA